MRRRQQCLKRNLSGPEGLAAGGAPAVLRGLAVEPTLGVAARLASAPSRCQRGSRGTPGQAPSAHPIHLCSTTCGRRAIAGYRRGPSRESRRGSLRGQRYLYLRVIGPDRTERQRQRHRQDSREPRNGVVADNELSGIVANGTGARDLRRAGDRAGSVVAKNSPHHELLLVRAKANLCDSGDLRSTGKGIDRKDFRGSSNAAGLLGTEQRRRVHDCALYGRFGAGLLGAELDCANGAAKRPPQNVAGAALPC